MPPGCSVCDSGLMLMIAAPVTAVPGSHRARRPLADETHGTPRSRARPAPPKVAHCGLPGDRVLCVAEGQRHVPDEGVEACALVICVGGVL